MHSHHQHREALPLARRSSRLHPPGTFEHWPLARLSHSDSLAENAVVATANATIDETSFGALVSSQACRRERSSRGAGCAGAATRSRRRNGAAGSAFFIRGGPTGLDPAAADPARRRRPGRRPMAGVAERWSWFPVSSSGSHATLRWRKVDSNPRSPSTVSSVHSGACDATHAAIVKPGTPDRARRRENLARSCPFIRRVRGGPRRRAGAGGSATGVAPKAGGDRGRDR